MEALSSHITFLMIGSGNMAFSLGKALVRHGHKPSGVFSRNATTGTELAKILETTFYPDLHQVKEPDMVFLCVSDTQIASVSELLKDWKDCIICHCSGAMPLSVLIKSVSQCGVFYPLQTVQKNVPMNWNSVPILIEGKTKEIEIKLLTLANTLSGNVAVCDSKMRAQYHLAAVVVNNFTTHLIALAQDYCSNHQLDFKILLPLLNETMLRLQTGNAKDRQTGPAVRNDNVTIERHLQLLKEQPALEKLYRLFTDSIQQK